MPHLQPDGFTRVADRQKEEQGAPVLARLRVAHHRTIAVVDLVLLAECRRDRHARVRQRRAAEDHDMRRTRAYRAVKL